MNKKYLNTLSHCVVSCGVGSVLAFGLAGCTDSSQNNSNIGGIEKQNAFVIIEKNADGGYAIAEEFPAKKTTIVLREANGNERILSKEEIDKLVAEEKAKIDDKTSPLTNPELSNGHMGLGGVLLSSIAGAMIGSYIGNKLFNNPNFQAQRATNYKSPSAYSKSVNSFKKARASSGKKSGFFGSNTKKKKSRSIFGG